MQKYLKHLKSLFILNFPKNSKILDNKLANRQEEMLIPMIEIKTIIRKFRIAMRMNIDNESGQISQ